MYSVAFALVAAAIAQTPQQPSYPAGCEGPTFPDGNVCLQKNWFLGAGAKDPCAPLGSYPVVGQQVYIQDPFNFCINLPDPNNAVLKREFYSQGKLPTIVAAEGYIQSFCVGNYYTPGAATMPAGAIRSAHVVKAVHPSGKKYIQISGTMDCGALGIDC
ncbi:hypothetical protein HDU91_000874, partial [Kappamyces sp. JEL0680]